MCVTGKVKYVSSGNPDFTVNAEYNIIAITSNDLATANAIVIDDNGAVVATGSLAGSPFIVTELYAPTKLV